MGAGGARIWGVDLRWELGICRFLGWRVSGSRRFGTKGLGSRVGLYFRAYDAGFTASGFGIGIKGSQEWALVFRFRLWGIGLRRNAKTPKLEVSSRL